MEEDVGKRKPKLRATLHCYENLDSGTVAEEKPNTASSTPSALLCLFVYFWIREDEVPAPAGYVIIIYVAHPTRFN